jgi:hypothetical protein
MSAGSGTFSLAGQTSTLATNATWQLATGHYVQAQISPIIVHPRPDNDAGGLAGGNPNSWERARLAPDGIGWRIPIAVYGGAWPFQYTLLQGPAGMSIGQHYGDTDYGILSWTNPVIGTYTIQVQVTTQDFGRTTGSADSSGQYSVTWTLVVADHTDSTKFIYLDAVNGNDSNNGSFAAPWKTLAGFANATGTAGKQLIFRNGTYAFNVLSSILDLSSKAKVWIGYQGESATIDYSGAWSGTDMWVLMNGSSGAGSGGCSACNLTFNGSPSNWATVNSGNNHDQFHIFHYGDRALYFENTFTNMNGFNTNGNWSNWQGVFPAATSTMHNYFTYVKNTLSNMQNMQSGGGLIAYSMRGFVVENNTVSGFSNPKNIQSGIFIKGHNSKGSVRNNKAWVQSGTFSSPAAGISTGGVVMYQGQDGGSGDNPDQNETCWNLMFNTIGPNNGAFPSATVYGNATFASWTGWEYRNTVVGPRWVSGSASFTNTLTSIGNLICSEHGVENDATHYGATNVTLNVNGDIVDSYSNRTNVVDPNTGFILSSYATAHGITIGTVGHQVA